MNLMEILCRECVKAPLAASDKKGIIDELVDVLDAAGKIDDAVALQTAVWSREQARTTGIGHGLAIPHGKCESVPSLVMAIGKPAEPVDFASIDGKPVRFIVLLASPPHKTSDHIQALARISRLLTDETVREQMYEAADADVIYSLLQAQEETASSSTG